MSDAYGNRTGDAKKASDAKPKKKPVTVYLDPLDYERVSAAAYELRVPIAWIVREGLGLIQTMLETQNGGAFAEPGGPIPTGRPRLDLARIQNQLSLARVEAMQLLLKAEQAEKRTKTKTRKPSKKQSARQGKSA